MKPVTHDVNNREYLRRDQLSNGISIELDADFTCAKAGTHYIGVYKCS